MTSSPIAVSTSALSRPDSLLWITHTYGYTDTHELAFLQRRSYRIDCIPKRNPNSHSKYNPDDKESI